MNDPRCKQLYDIFIIFNEYLWKNTQVNAQKSIICPVAPS